MKVIKGYTFPVNTEDVAHSMIKRIYTAFFNLHIKVVKRGNPRSSLHKEKQLFYSLMLFLYKIMDVH